MDILKNLLALFLIGAALWLGVLIAEAVVVVLTDALTALQPSG